MSLSEREIRSIMDRTAKQVGTGQSGSAPVRPIDAQRLGIFQDVDSAVNAAYAAFQQYERMALSDRKRIVAAMRDKMRQHGRELAHEAAEETGLGRAEDKVKKNELVTEKTPGPEILESVAWSGDDGLTLVERAPFGVVAAITPTTNPTSTIINNAISILSAGNAVAFNVHPNAKQVSAKNIRLLNEAILSAGGPANLITAVAEPSIDSAQALMRHPRARLLLVTGGGGVVVEAMRSGKRAITAGPGNPPVVVDESADIEQAGRSIVFGASFDNNVICTDEKELFVVEKVAAALKQAMQRAGAFFVERSHEQRRLMETIFKEYNTSPRGISKMRNEWIGKNAGVILQAAGIDAPRDLRLAVVEVPLDHTLVWTEQMMPIFPFVRLPDVGTCIEMAIAAESGNGHSAAMYSCNIDHLSEMARRINTSIFVKNGPTLAGLGYGGEGYTSFSIASPTGEGLTTALSFSRPRRCTMVDHFRIV
ncbi:MAG: aldehyde dehydrogenase EutE [Ardenticatenales bacterium]|nr:aldehyde dehydrogenase EutE [Ardenticatenales bacterium]